MEEDIPIPSIYLRIRAWNLLGPLNVLRALSSQNISNSLWFGSTKFHLGLSPMQIWKSNCKQLMRARTMSGGGGRDKVRRIEVATYKVMSTFP